MDYLIFSLILLGWLALGGFAFYATKKALKNFREESRGDDEESALEPKYVELDFEADRKLFYLLVVSTPLGFLAYKFGKSCITGSDLKNWLLFILFLCLFLGTIAVQLRSVFLARHSFRADSDGICVFSFSGNQIDSIPWSDVARFDVYYDGFCTLSSRNSGRTYYFFNAKDIAHENMFSAYDFIQFAQCQLAKQQLSSPFEERGFLDDVYKKHMQHK